MCKQKHFDSECFVISSIYQRLIIFLFFNHEVFFSFIFPDSQYLNLQRYYNTVQIYFATELSTERQLMEENI